MSAFEWMGAITGALVGYWIVSALYDRLAGKTPQSSEASAPADSGTLETPGGAPSRDFKCPACARALAAAGTAPTVDMTCGHCGAQFRAEFMLVGPPVFSRLRRR